MKRKGLALVVAIIMVATLVMPAFANMPFADVPKDHWAYDSVAELAASGLIIGYPDGTFKGERQFTRYEMAMVFARVLGRLDTLIAAEVGAEIKAGTAGLSDEIYNKVAQALVEEVAKAKAELTAHVETELANVELPEAKVVERVVVEQPVEVLQPFELTDEAKAVIAKVAADEVAENVAKLEPKVVEKLVELDPEVTTKDLEGLMAAVASAQMSADLNAEDIIVLQENLAIAREMIDEVKFGLEVNEAVLSVADKKADLALTRVGEAQAAADEAKDMAGTATEQALAALKGAEDASAAAAVATAKADAASQQLRNLAMTVAALEGDVDALAALLKTTSQAMESEVAALSEEFGAELASLGVRVADLENIVIENSARIDLLEWEVAQLDDELGGVASDVEDLRVADQVLAEDLSTLEDEHAATVEKLTVVDGEQKATAADFADFKAEHEKVRLSGSTETVFNNIGIVGDTDGDDKVFKDPRDRNDDNRYERTSELKQTFDLNLEATPAEGVKVTAGLVGVTDIFGNTKQEHDQAWGLKNLKVQVTTDQALRSFFAGNRAAGDVSARYNEFIIKGDPGDKEAVAANVVLGNLDTEVQLFRPWDGDTLGAHEANYGALVNSAYKLSDAFVIDLQYARMWNDPSAGTGDVEDWAYSLGLRGELTFADYEVAYASTDGKKSGYKLDVGKEYESGLDWNVFYKAVQDGYYTHLTADDVDKYKSELKLDAGYTIWDIDLGATYVDKKVNESYTSDSDLNAMKFTAERTGFFGIPVTVRGEYAKLKHPAVDNGSSLLGKVAYEPVFGNLKLGASYQYTTNANDAFDDPGKWVEKNNAGEPVPEHAYELSAEYDLEIWDTTITPYASYKDRKSPEMKTAYGREYQKGLTTLGVKADRDFGKANVLASYQYRTGGPNNVEENDGDDAEIDKIAEVKLTYPVVDGADLELKYRLVDADKYNEETYKATELHAGLKFTF